MTLTRYTVPPYQPPHEVADAWESWCGPTQWSKALRQFGELGGEIRWLEGYPQSKSAIPLVFSLRLWGHPLFGMGRLKDIRRAVARAKAERSSP